MPNSRTSDLSRYVPRISAEWDLDAPGRLWQQRDGTLVFVDISGFTSLSERLARKGRIGAEELTNVLNRVFGKMLDVAFERGGSLLKFGGDALLLFFETEDHVLQATAATVEMRAALRDASTERTSVGRIHLKMSSGIHTGSVDFFLVGDSHRELIVSGPAASMTHEMEGTADAGEICVSPSVKESLPKGFTGAANGIGWLLRKQKVNHPICGEIPRRDIDNDTYATRIPFGLLEQLSTGLTEPEHRMATIGFIEFNGVDELLEKEGPERVGEALDRLITTIQGATDDEGVSFLATDVDADGGKVILAAGVPSSRHDDEGRVLRAARRVLDTDVGLSVRMGANRGHVFAGNVGTDTRSTFTVMGDTVNLAARLMAAAPSSGLYTSPTVLDRSSTLFRTEALEPFYVKGKQLPVQAYQAFEETGTRTTEASRELPFKGRDAELDLIVTIVTTCAQSGRGGMMTISGDTGTGKSRLIAEVIERCPGLDTMMVQAEPNGTDNPYWAFRDPLRRALEIERGTHDEMIDALLAAIRQVAPDLEPSAPLLGDVIHIEVPDNDATAAIDPQFRPDRTADAIIELFEAVYPGPFAVLAEDGHWMDDASIQLLRRIGDAAETRPWTVIFTARREGTHFEPLGEEIALRPLTDATIREIAIEATSAAPLRPHELESLVDRVDGNPLFLEQMLGLIRATGGAENLPDSLGAVASADIDTLAPLSRQLLRFSSVLGRSFNRDLLNMFLAPEEVVLDDATRKELDRFLELDGDRLRFRHAVVHDAAYQGLSYRRRRELHRRAGDLVERIAEDPETSAEFLANHYSSAAVYDKAWHYSNLAADKAKTAYANTEAVVHYQRAIEAASHAPDIDSADLAMVWRGMGEVQDLAGRFEDARESFGRALSTCRDDPVMAASLHLRRAEAWYGSGNLTQAKRSITSGKKALGTATNPKSRRSLAHLEAWEASVHAAGGDPVKAYSAGRRAVKQAVAANEDEALARAYTAIDWANFAMGTGEPKHGEEIVKIYDRIGKTERSVVVLNNLGAFSYFEGDWRQTMEWYAKGVDAAEKSGNVNEAAHIRTAMAEVLINQRRFDEAVPLIKGADRVMRSSKAAASLPFVALQRARLNLSLGNRQAGIEELESLLSEQLTGRETEWTGDTAVLLAGQLVAAGRGKQGLDWLDRLEAAAPDSFEWVTPGVLRVRALAERDPRVALTLLTEARAAAEAKGDPLEEVQIAEALLQTKNRAGEDPDPVASDHLLDLYERLDIQAERPALST